MDSQPHSGAGQAALLPLSAEARAAIKADAVPLHTFPFRVGRESRFGVLRGQIVSMERRNQQADPNNELYIHDDAEVLNVSREHFQIERKADGGYELVDRGSTCGTLVDDQPAGGESSVSRRPLRDGSIIRIGTSASPYIFRFAANGR